MTRRFIRHYFEMVLAMLLGMLVLGGATSVLLEAVGVNVGNWDHDLPALFLFAMAFTMTVPMVAWMRYRGHSAARSAEMAGSMIVPTLLAAALALIGALETGAALGVQHAVMIPAMLGVMLWRYEHYSRTHA